MYKKRIPIAIRKSILVNNEVLTGCCWIGLLLTIHFKNWILDCQSVFSVSIQIPKKIAQWSLGRQASVRIQRLG